jgi:predicted MPP superfamily phosphohydrolase
MAPPAKPTRQVPRPTGPFSGARTPWRRAFAGLVGAINRGLDRLPPARWLHRRIHRSFELPELTLPLRAGVVGLDGLRLAFVTDVHAGSFCDESDLERIFDRVQAAAPDLVLFGGDLINTRDREVLLFKGPLQRLRPRYGMFAVPGNHDHFFGRDIDLWRAFLQDQGVEVLVNRGCRIEHGGGSLWLCGVDDLTEGTPDLAAALRGRRQAEPAVLLSHHPDFFFEAAAADVDLQLSGHTHGGQIRLAGWAPIHHSRFGYERGWFVENDCRLYVSRGVGVTVLPLRIDAAPEVPLVTFRQLAVAGAPRSTTGAAAAPAGHTAVRAP